MRRTMRPIAVSTGCALSKAALSPPTRKTSSLPCACAMRARTPAHRGRRTPLRRRRLRDLARERRRVGARIDDDRALRRGADATPFRRRRASPRALRRRPHDRADELRALRRRRPANRRPRCPCRRTAWSSPCRGCTRAACGLRRCRFSAMRDPIAPRPMKATVVMLEAPLMVQDLRQEELRALGARRAEEVVLGARPRRSCPRP